MKTIALIHPKIDFEDNYPCSWIPFSLLSIGSTLPKDRFEIQIFDENCIEKDEIYKQLSKKEVLIIGISIMTGGGQIGNGLEIAERLKKEHKDVTIVFGGPHANVLPEQTAECDIIDYVLSGMGQIAFRDLVDSLDKGVELDYIQGLYYKYNGRIVRPKVAKACVPYLMPYDFSLVNLAQYIKYDSTISDRTLNYIASQGCPYGCKFCYECIYSRKYYRMKTENVIRDISIYANDFRVDGVKFYDADFFVNKKEVENIIPTLMEYDMKWAASIHPNDILKSQNGNSNLLLDTISKSKCTRLLMGMESGSNRILQNVIHKNTRAEDYLLIAKTIAEYGILGSYTFMVGFPGETEQEYEETFELVEKLWNLQIPIETKIHIYLPYPGTPLFADSIAFGYKPPERLADWSEYNYYKAMTPWTDESLERKLAAYTHMIDKNRRRNI